MLDFAEHEISNSSNVCSQLKNKKILKIASFQNYRNRCSLITDSLSNQAHTRNKKSNITFPEKFI